MAKKARQRISYVLESAKASAGGHRLGVNGLAVDTDNGILYSGGRDGIVCAWDLNLNADNSDKNKPRTTFRAQTQAHTHWVNDIALAKNNSALLSVSSDLTVKLWRPHSEEESLRAHVIGEHADYVKCVETPPADMNLDWIAAAGFDRKICLWDLNGGGKTLEIDVRGDEAAEKGSVYALSVGRNLIASGGPEKVVRLYDPRTGSRVSKLVGHVDMIRAILVDQAGETALSASADKTVKLWSLKEGRCMYTFTMHDESVWSLFSDDPRLGIFYSSDRSGLVAKTDVRGSLEDMDDGLSLAVAKEHLSVCRVVAAGGNIWTATSQSSINRWEDIDTGAGVQLPEAFRHQRAASVASSRPRQPSLPQADPPKKREISAQSILRISNLAAFPRPTVDLEATSPGEVPRKGSEVVADHDAEVKPIHQLPEETIEGQFGLLKHKLLNDRRRVLTLDTAGDVLMWDLIKCKPIQSFGKQHLEDVEMTVNTREAVAPWCTVDLSSGNLTVVLEPFNCFDAEVYADELEFEEPVEFREDQRISLGRWILRYLFANLIDEEIKRDEAYRQKLNEEVEKKHGGSRANAPMSIDIPPLNQIWENTDAVTTPRANGSNYPAITPGLGIGLATPAPAQGLTTPSGVAVSSPLSPDKGRASGERDDYFTSSITANDAAKSAAVPATPATETADAKASGEDKGKDKDKAADTAKSPTSAFGKKFRMSFSTKKLARSGSQPTQDKPAVVDEKAEESESSSSHEKEVDDSFYGVVQKIRNEYDKATTETPDKFVETRVTPSLPNETPVLKLPPATKIIIQEETSGGSANIYQGTVESAGRDADIIEQKAPMWLGDLLLQNQIPIKDPVKISFVLYPLGDLPAIAAEEGNNRLNANKMLRVRKILAYVAERIEPQPAQPEEDPDALRPEDYLELYCNDQLLSNTMSLATLRTHVWKGGNDIVLHYKANGRKVIQPLEQPVVAEAETNGEVAAPAAAEP
ncbi:WD repeat protein [Stachybotrys elegans]|uniref:WD repeat protein n=1 Tax=Stachybotrys elegans TaxID=80388 RepID=A0A8K0SMH9_9HYPO|nr:WD repeat protein [Stachybotrys elegans]